MKLSNSDGPWKTKTKCANSAFLSCATFSTDFPGNVNRTWNLPASTLVWVASHSSQSNEMGPCDGGTGKKLTWGQRKKRPMSTNMAIINSGCGSQRKRCEAQI